MTFHDSSDETAELYAAGLLSESDLSAFERHLLVCEECRNEVRLASLIRHELAKPAAPRKAWIYMAGAGLAAAIVLAVTLPNRTGMSSLGAVSSAPGYMGIAVRATADPADSAFAAAMLLYGTGSFTESADALRAARAAGADSVTTTFFLGASLLMSRRAKEAADEFGRVALMSRTAYTDESHFYRAKALLQLGSTREALRELAAASAIDNPVRSHARALADSIEGAR